MAIIRGGKRIGPFDIRVGVGRDQSYQNIDKDPRLKQKANPETTINRFRSAIARGEGFSRPSRFLVFINLPKGVSNNALENTLSNKTLSPNEASIPSLNTDLRYAMLMCDTAEFPGRTLSTQTRNQHGVTQEIVDGVTYGDSITATFYCDKFMREKQIFEHWQKVAFNPVTYNINYSSEYTAPIEIYQLGSFSSQNDRDRITYAVRLEEAFPKVIASQDLSYSTTDEVHKISIEFSFKFWRNIVTDSGAQYGASFADKTTGIASVDNSGFAIPEWLRNIPIVGGIVENLSADAQRTIRDTANQAINQIPVGKLFGGKVFPPFL